MTVAMPLADVAETWVRDFEHLTGQRLAAVDGATLLGERAMLGGFRIPSRVSAGGGCRIFDTRTGGVALNLARPDDWTLLPALFETDADYRDVAAVAAGMVMQDGDDLVARGRVLGLAIAAANGTPDIVRACTVIMRAAGSSPPGRRAPRVLDLSALWAGPLAAHLLWLAGADVTKIESRTRPDAMRRGDAAFFALLNQGKASVALDLTVAAEREALLALIARSDIVIEAARPRALEHLGIRANELVRGQPGLTWITITGHGAQGDAANWVGFGDDCAMSAGLGAALHDVAGRTGFVGDAVADPLTGIRAAGVAWQAWKSGQGGRYGLAMSGVVAEAMAIARRSGDFDALLIAWAAAEGMPFPTVQSRTTGPVAALGADTRTALAELLLC
ncbi:CoA transferase [Sphingomonas sp. R86520]|uniref:CoA transferase n=1 Tax=Sphingomonas sp. R86520 TaxID=3093859 RepID=UPI0036D2242A